MITTLLLPLLAGARAALTGGGSTPVVTVVGHGGACPADDGFGGMTDLVAASVDISWNWIGPSTGHQVLVREVGGNGLIATLAGNATSFNGWVPDPSAVAGAPYHTFVWSVDYQVQLVRVSDGAIIHDATTHWTASYGQCRP